MSDVLDTLKLGDIVRHKAGGPCMAVARIQEPREDNKGDQSTRYTCSYYETAISAFVESPAFVREVIEFVQEG